MAATPMEENTEHLIALALADVWDAVLNLSLPAEDQLLILEARGDRGAVDELALALDDASWVVEDALSRQLISSDEREALHNLDEFLNNFSGEAAAEKWTPDALAKSDEWRRVRELAVAALTKRQLFRIQNAAP
jgi:hypothetical protein